MQDAPIRCDRFKSTPEAVAYTYWFIYQDTQFSGLLYLPSDSCLKHLSSNGSLRLLSARLCESK